MPSRSPTPSLSSLPQAIELSVVIPCLDEADTVGGCVEKAVRAMADHGISGEVVVADNGSVDDSRGIAKRSGARVTTVAERGYGNALMAGIRTARGRYIIMGDADGSYDFLEIPRFLEKLRDGAGLVQGCRLPSGGGRIMKGAMPFLHRWLGNPALSFIAKLMFKLSVHDINCGLRGFSRELFDRLDLRCTGMEFATEMIIKTSLRHEDVVEIPITLHPDGRIAHPPHLRTFRDGWRTLRFYFLFSPRWLFLYPGMSLLSLSSVWFLSSWGLMRIGTATLGINSMLVASFGILLGYEMIIFAIVSCTIAEKARLLSPSPTLGRISRSVTIERGVAVAFALCVAGLTLIATVAWYWVSHGFPPLDYLLHTPRVVTGVLLCALGIQTFFSAFFVSSIGLESRP